MLPEMDCGDCGIDTGPYGICEYYMVSDAVWGAAGMPVITREDAEEIVEQINTGRISYEDGEKLIGGGGFLCIGCLENRIQRTLTRADFIEAPVNHPSNQMSVRLQDRLSRI
jgi:hypothetical protein